MVVLRNDAEGFTTGATVDTVVASPDAFTRATVASGGTCTVETGAAIDGSKGFRSGGPSGSAFQAGWYNSASSSTAVAASARFKGRAAPTADQRILNLIGTTASTTRPYFIHRTTGNIELWNAAHALVAGWTPTAFPTASTDVCELRIYAIRGTTTSNGTLHGEMRINGTVVQSVTLDGTANTGTTALCGGWYGRPTSSTNTTTWDWDSPAFEFDATGLIPALGTLTFSGADAAGLTDALTVETVNDETTTEPLGLTDAATAVLIAARDIIDTAALVDTVTATLTIARDVADPAGITDAVTATLLVLLTASSTDPAGMTDAVAAALDLARSTTDVAGITDAALAAADIARDVADVAGLTDTVTIERTVTIAEAMGLLDAATSPSAWADVALTGTVGARRHGGRVDTTRRVAGSAIASRRWNGDL